MAFFPVGIVPQASVRKFTATATPAISPAALSTGPPDDPGAACSVVMNWSFGIVVYSTDETTPEAQMATAGSDEYLPS